MKEPGGAMKSLRKRYEIRKMAQGRKRGKRIVEKGEVGLEEKRLKEGEISHGEIKLRDG